MNEKFLEVGDVIKKGYIVICGKVSRKYFEERIYGMSDAG